MSFKVGSCAVVLARKYVAILVGLILLIVGACVLRSTIHLNTTVQETHKGASSMLSWEDFLAECGPKTSLRQRSSTSHAFDDKFRRRTFTWRGEVHMIREGIDVLFLRTKSVVMIKMYPARYPKRDSPDVALLFGEDRNREVGELMPGDWVEFEATMTAHGYRGDPEIMSLWHIKKLEKRPEPLSSSAHLRDADDSLHGGDQEPAAKAEAKAEAENAEGKVEKALNAEPKDLEKAVPEAKEAAAEDDAPASGKEEPAGGEPDAAAPA